MPNNNQRAHKSLRATVSTVTWLGLAMIGLIWAGVEMDVRQERHFAHRTAAQTAHNYARLFEEHINRALTEVDNTIKFIRQDFLRDPERFDLQSWTKNQYSFNDLALQFTIIGADGIMLSTTTPTNGGRVDLSDREHFRVHVGAPADTLFISKPVLGRASGRWSIQLTRKISDAKGRFLGVLVASLDPYRLSRFYESIDLGRGGSIAVVGRDQVVRARAGLSADNLGSRLDDPPFFERVLFYPTGQFDTASAAPGNTAVVAYRAIEDHPLIVTVTVDDTDAAAIRVTSEWNMRLLAGALTLIILGVVALGVRHRRSFDRAVDALSESQAKAAEASHELDLTLNNMSQGILMVDAAGHVAVINRRALELLDLPQSLMSERLSFAKLLEHQWQRGEFGSDGTGVSPTLRDYIRSGGLSDALPIYERTRPDGSVLEVRTAALPRGGFVRTYTDITERKTSERDLRVARDKAEAASKVRTAFLATMSHEIRTPLNGIIGMSSILEHTDLTEEQQAYLKTIHGCGEALLQIINDVLDYSKLDSGAVTLDETEVVLGDLVSRTTDILAPRIAEKRLALTVDQAADLPAMIRCDGGRIRQVLLNLVGNAVKFTEQGSINVTVAKIASEGADMARLRFTVTDTGIGIPQEAMSRLFQEFSQVDASITRRFGGTGLGLAISRRIVAALGGEIGVESVEGKGSTFWFEVPVRTLEGPAETGRAGALPALARSLRILLVEDNKVNQEVASLLLRRLGHEIEIADNGSVAVEMAHRSRFDLILMDMQMPVMDGIEATREVRAGMGACRAAPIIGLTANAFASDRQACLEAGMDGFLAKPITREKLAEVLVATGPQEAPGTAAALTGPLLNTDYRAMLFDEIGEDASRALVASFWREAATIHAELAAALASRDRDLVERCLHTLKGAAANMGYEGIVEVTSRHGFAAGGEAALASLTDVMERSRACDPYAEKGSFDEAAAAAA